MRRAFIIITLCTVVFSSNKATAQWASVGAMPAKAYAHNAVVLNDGRVLVVGLGSTLAFDPTTTSWASLASLPEDTLGGRTFTLLDSGDALLVGGDLPASGYQGSANAFVFKVATNSWSAPVSMLVGRYSHSAAKLPDGRVMVCGGSTTPAASFLTSCEVFDSTGNPAFTAGAALTTGRDHQIAVVLPSGNVMVTGGIGPNGFLQSTEVFGVGTGWNPGAEMNEAHGRPVAVQFDDGAVLLFGGTDRQTVELFDPASNQWSTVGGLAVARDKFGYSLMGNGCVIAAGGFSTQGTLDTVEFFDRKTGNWTLGPQLPAARSYSAAVTLKDGRVLVTGGFDGDVAGTDAAWVLDLLALGEPCSHDCECANGTCAAGVCCDGFEVDGVCCQTACDGTCEACDADGVCRPAAEGTDPGDECDDESAASCGEDGECDGSGACRLYADGTGCGTNGCEGTTLSSAICNGAGQCLTSSVACAPYECDSSASACFASCSSIDQCSPANVCFVDGTCGSVQDDGTSVAQNSGCSCRSTAGATPREWLAACVAALACCSRRRRAVGARRRAGC
jgi:hypothetical protein